MGAAYLWPQTFGHEMSLPEFLLAYRPFLLVVKLGFFSLSSRQGRKLIDECPSNNKGWKTKFFHVSTLGICEDILGSGVHLPTA